MSELLNQVVGQPPSILFKLRQCYNNFGKVGLWKKFTILVYFFPFWSALYNCSAFTCHLTSYMPQQLRFGTNLSSHAATPYRMYRYRNADKRTVPLFSTRPRRNSSWVMNANLLPYYQFTNMQETLSDLVCALQFRVYAIYVRLCEIGPRTSFFYLHTMLFIVYLLLACFLSGHWKHAENLCSAVPKKTCFLSHTLFSTVTNTTGGSFCVPRNITHFLLSDWKKFKLFRVILVYRHAKLVFCKLVSC